MNAVFIFTLDKQFIESLAYNTRKFTTLNTYIFPGIIFNTSPGRNCNNHINIAIVNLPDLFLFP